MALDIDPGMRHVHKLIGNFEIINYFIKQILFWGRHGYYRIVVGFTSAYAISICRY
jgi:hypothetical protein